MIDRPAISIVMPVYNARRYVGLAIQSMLEQVFTDFEMLVFDDGSTDGSLEIIRRYARYDPRIRVSCRRHRGLVQVLNEGIADARADLVARMDADDVALPHRLLDQVEFLRNRHDLVVLGGQVEMIDTHGLPLGLKRLPLEHDQLEHGMLRGRGDFICHPAAMMRRDAVCAVGGYRQEYEYVEDLDLWLRLAEKGRLANLPQVILQYRYHINSICYTRVDLQHARAKACIAETLNRRGESDHILSEFQHATQRERTWSAVYRDWVLTAIDHGHWHTAVVYVVKAFLASPVSFLAWSAVRARDVAFRFARRWFAAARGTTQKTASTGSAAVSRSSGRKST